MVNQKLIDNRRSIIDNKKEKLLEFTMSLLNLILNAIDNPEQEASTGQLSDIIRTVQQVSNTTQSNPSAIESAMSILGKYTKSALQEKRNQVGEAGVEQVVNQYAGTQPNPEAVSNVFSPNQLDKILAEIEARTGINQNQLKSLIPLLLPLVLNFLKTGNSSTNSSVNSPNRPQNSVLSGFLDTDRDGDVDIMDAMSLARRYL